MPAILSCSNRGLQGEWGLHQQIQMLLWASVAKHRNKAEVPWCFLFD
jgi:hypothetical protein